MQSVLRLQAQLEQLELTHNGGGPVSCPAPTRQPESLTLRTAEPLDETHLSGTGSREWVVPCVSVDSEGRSFFSEKRVALRRASSPSSIGALSDLIPATGEHLRCAAYAISRLERLFGQQSIILFLVSCCALCPASKMGRADSGHSVSGLTRHRHPEVQGVRLLQSSTALLTIKAALHERSNFGPYQVRCSPMEAQQNSVLGTGNVYESPLACRPLMGSLPRQKPSIPNGRKR